MKAEVRQILGKAAYEGTLKYLGEPGRRWDILGKEVQEAYCIEAEEVVRQLAAVRNPIAKARGLQTVGSFILVSCKLA